MCTLIISNYEKNGIIKIVKSLAESGLQVMLAHPLIHFEISKCYQDEPIFKSVTSKNSLPKVKD